MYMLLNGKGNQDMKICNASGNGVCVNCDGTPPKINGYSCGDVCRKTVQEIINRLSDGDIVHYDCVINKFCSRNFPDDVWEIIE